MLTKQKKANFNRSHQRLNLKLTMIYILLIILFASLLIFL